MSAFEQYYTELFRFLSRKLRDRTVAEDLTQETFTRALAVPRQVESHRGLLYQIARNLLVDRYRQQQDQACASLQDEDAAALPAPGGEQPDAQIENRRYVASMVATIEQLPPRCREAFLLHRIDGLSQQEVANAMGISVNMVEKHIIRAMVACRRCREAFVDEQGDRAGESGGKEEGHHGAA